MDKYIETAKDDFGKITKKPEIYLSNEENHAKEIKALLKRSYDYTKSLEPATLKSNALPELIVKDFDLEQIWQQIELQNDGFLTRSLSNISKLIVGKNKLVFNELENVKNYEEAIEKDVNSNSETDDSSSDEDDNNLPLAPIIDGDESDDFSLNSDDLDENVEMIEENPRKKIRPSVVDDKFFKLDEMEAFLNAEEKKMNDEEPDSGNDSESDDNEEINEDDEIDLFKEDSDDMENNETERGKSKNPKYNDFFREEIENPKQIKRNKFMEENEAEEEVANEVINNENEELKSTLELREERLKRKIGYFEEAAVGEKPWQMKGEVKAANRPQNSLLQEVVEFDLTSRPAPVITQETTVILEDVIRQRIKDKVFDSVERRQKPVDTPYEYKKKLVMDQEKSKESLAQIYEKDYLKQKEAQDPNAAEIEEKEPQLHTDINVMMRGLFMKLDALSNFHFTPKASIPDLKIVSNLPAINIEEVAPVATSDAALLAPEEIRGKAKGDEIGKTERTDTDKKRERRKKKDKQKFHANKKKATDIIDKMKPGLGNKYSKEKAKKLLEQVTKDRNIDKMDESSGSKSVKSSTAFFSQLQDEVQSQIKNKTQNKTKLKKGLEAKKMKL